MSTCSLLRKFSLPFATLAAAIVLATPAQALPIKVTITSLAPAQGVEFTPVWVGFHDGTFDTYNLGDPASAALERLAEDGNTKPISDAFSAAGYDKQATIFSPGGLLPPIFESGESNYFYFDLDGNNADNRFFSLLSMIVPSNDAFIGNVNPAGHRIFNDDGSFKGDDFIVRGAGVRDAGTEVNDEIPANTARFGQMMPNTGVSEGGVIGAHKGFIPGGNILSAFPNADFTAPGYLIAHVQIQAVPEPATIAMLLAGLGLMGLTTRRRRNQNSDNLTACPI